MATPTFAADSRDLLDNKVSPDAPVQQSVAPNQVAVSASVGAPVGGAAQPAETPATTQTTGESSTKSADAQKSPTGAGPSASGGTPATAAPAVASSIPGPGSQPASTAGAAGPGSQPATAPSPTGDAPSTVKPGMQVTESSSGASYVTPKEGTTLTAQAPDNSRFTDKTVEQERLKVKDRETGGRVYGRGEVESNIQRDEFGNIATNQNLIEEKYTQKTGSRPDGHGGWIVDYVKFDPKGRPMSPAEDLEGWNKLQPEQQEAAMREYLRNMDDYAKKTGTAKPEIGGGLDSEFFDPEKWAELPDEARTEAVKAWLEGKKVKRDEAAAAEADAPKITVNPDGSVSYKATDSKGNALNPWDDAAAWKTLTKDQQNSLLEQFKTNSATIAAGGTPGEDQDYLGSGMAESAFKNLNPEDQGWVLQNPGWQAPQRNADQSVTYTEKPAEGQTGTHSYTLDKDGFKTSESWPSGIFAEGPVTYTYGRDGSFTATFGESSYKTDSQGNSVVTDNANGWVITTASGGMPVVSALEGSEAATQLSAGYGMDGKKMTPTQRLASDLGVNVEDLSEDQLRSLSETITNFAYNNENYANSKATGMLALASGLISQAEFDAIDSSNKAERSWAAWAAQNPDVLRALENAGVTQEQRDRVIREHRIAKPRNMVSDPYVPGDYFINIQNDAGRTSATAADALAGVNPMALLYA